jgi:hypothetical protein
MDSMKVEFNIMANYCEDCGCKVYSGRCTNCHEELYILDQYYEQDMKLPDENSDFMKKVIQHENDVINATHRAESVGNK